MTTQRSFVSKWVGWLAAIGLLLVADRAIADALSGHVESVDPAASQLVGLGGDFLEGRDTVQNMMAVNPGDLPDIGGA